MLRNLDLMARRRTTVVADLPEDPREALRLLAEVVWAVLDSERDLVRIMIREFAGFPDLFETMWQAVVAHLYRECTIWIGTLRDSGKTSVADLEATAAVLVASLTYYPILDLLIGHTPGDIEPRRFLDAWLDHAVRTLRPER